MLSRMPGWHYCIIILSHDRRRKRPGVGLRISNGLTLYKILPSNRPFMRMASSECLLVKCEGGIE